MNVATLIARFAKQMPTRESFKLGMTIEQARMYIGAAVYSNVAHRGHKCVKSEKLSSYITQAAEWLTTEDYPCLLLCGQSGNGKTTLMDALRMVINDCELKDMQGTKVYCRITNAKEVANMSKRDYKAFSDLCKYPILTLDDLGTEPMEVMDYGNIINPVLDLLTVRYENQLMTIITTNLTPKQIREKYGNRVADRLNEFVQKIIFELPSYRGNTQRTAKEPL